MRVKSRLPRAFLCPISGRMNELMPLSKALLDQAIDSGKLICLPTETVYGLAAPIDRSDLLSRIFTLKERPLFDPLIVHVENTEAAKNLALEWPEAAEQLAAAFWPGPLTLILKRNPDLISDLITAGLPTVGVRVPAHPVAREILRLISTPLAAPSANKFTKTSPTTLEHVKQSFSAQDVLFIEGGSCEVGLESTIVEVSEKSVVILRRGMITSEDIARVLGTDYKISFGLSAAENAHQVVAPGMHYIHYRPEWPVIVGKGKLLEQKQRSWPDYASLLCEERMVDGDPLLAARAIYGLLRTPLQAGYQALYLDVSLLDFADERVQAIWDRLQKAMSLCLF